MSSESLVRYCEYLKDDLPHAKRCLAAMRRSGRDVYFNGHLATRRLSIEISKPMTIIVRWLARYL
jgi:hypothetical protein